MTEKQLADIVKRGHCSITGEQALKASAKQGRVSSKKIQVDGYFFDSQAEAHVYWEFKVDPDVELLALQPYFCLQKPFERGGKKYREISYKADFRIKEGGKEWIVEVKSQGTLKANSKSYPMRRKMFLKKFPALAFREIIFDKGKRIVKGY
jgi:hypothetical protein